MERLKIIGVCKEDQKVKEEAVAFAKERDMLDSVHFGEWRAISMCIACKYHGNISSKLLCYMQKQYGRDTDEVVIAVKNMQFHLYQYRHGLESGSGCEPVFFFGVLAESQHA